jgi:hypothetical protein
MEYEPKINLDARAHVKYFNLTVKFDTLTFAYVQRVYYLLTARATTYYKSRHCIVWLLIKAENRCIYGL